MLSMRSCDERRVGMSLTGVLVTGLFAGGVSCAAVQGGLLTGLVARQRHAVSLSGATPTLKQPAPSSRVADDLAPVAGFLGGKLVSHALVGGLLGGIGTAVQLSPQGRATMQVGAGLLIVCFGLAQLNVPGFRELTVSPPASMLRLVRGRARSSSALAPAILGLSTVLIPCGVTLSVMALALTSGSAAYGAATMAVFVVGTSPLFALIGYAAHKAATAWKQQLAFATGLALLVAGLYSLNGGLTLAGSPLAARNLPRTLGFAEAKADSSTVETAPDGVQQAVITVRPGEFAPENVLVKAGVPTTLVFRSDNAFGCVLALVIPTLGVQTVLPENGDTEIDAGVLKPGQIDYSCSMGMYGGSVTVK